MTAHQESNESKNRQKEGYHVTRLFVFILFQVNVLQADRIMSKNSRSRRVNHNSDPRFARRMYAPRKVSCNLAIVSCGQDSYSISPELESLLLAFELD
jgi:hypothetical protein